jgi:hypothetical protein
MSHGVVDGVARLAWGGSVGGVCSGNKGVVW